MTKLKDIASIAGVSISTVSKALNNSSEIRKETKANIVRIARDLNYDLGITQVDGSSKDGHSIGVICPEVDSNYYTQLISTIGIRISRLGYCYTVAVSDFQPEKEERYLEFFNDQGVDGIVLITENPNIQDIINPIKDVWRIPLVLITTGNDMDSFDCIRIDDYFGVMTGVEHLIKLGHKKIGYIGDNLTQGRLKALYDTLEKHGLSATKDHISISNLRFEECGYQGMKAIFDCGSYPTAIFSAYDDIAIGAMRAIREHGLSIPDDISIIGMDNVAVCPYLYKGLTTVSNSIKEMAVITISILSRKMKDKEFSAVQNVVLKPSLVIRETVAPLKK